MSRAGRCPASAIEANIVKQKSERVSGGRGGSRLISLGSIVDPVTLVDALQDGRTFKLSSELATEAVGSVGNLHLLTLFVS